MSIGHINFVYLQVIFSYRSTVGYRVRVYPYRSIVEKSLEYKTFKLGYASAYYSFYETFCKEYGDETADKMFGVNKDDKEPFLHEFYEMVQIRKETVDKSSD